MERQIEKYFQEELNADERLDFLKQVESDNELKKQFIKFKNTYALLSFSDAACGKKTTRDSYTQFLCKMRAKHIRQISFYLFKYAAIITLLIIFAYQAGVNQHSEILQENIENKLHVPAGQRIKLTLQDGTTVWLNSHTTLTYPAIFDKKERRVAIDGEAFFIVAQDKHKPFIVSSQGIETKVLGTQFNICSYRKNNDVRTSLIEGSLQIYFTGKENESIILSPNEQISIKNGTIKVDTISHHDYFLWKEGIYSFKDELLVDILNKLQLYYDVRIIIRNPSINQEKYTGKFRQRDSIDDILRILAIVTDAQLQENSSYQYGYVEHYTVTDKGNTDLIRFGRMYDELGWEFAWEMHRRRDAIRFGVYTKKSWLSHKPQGDYRSVFPIPEKVLTSNPNLEQNPHYK